MLMIEKIDDLSSVLATRFCAILRYNTQLEWKGDTNELSQHLIQSINLVFKSIPKLLWDSNAYNAVNDKLDVPLIYDALSNFVTEAEDYVTEQLHHRYFNFTERANIAAHYMLLRYIETYYADLIALVTVHFNSDLLEHKDKTGNPQDDIPNAFLSILRERMAYPLSMKSLLAIKGSVCVNKHSFEFADVRDCVSFEDFPRIVDNCGYSDTGGGWRTTHRDLRILLHRFISQQGLVEVASESKYPMMTISPSTGS